MTKILPVKKNKYGERVADISVDKYYTQIFEEVLEAHEESVIGLADYLEAEELVDVIACCITRFDILGFKDYKLNKVRGAGNVDANFYAHLTQQVAEAYTATKKEPIIEFVELAGIINVCRVRLEYLGFNEDKRQKLYDRVNTKNRKRGYFDD